MRASAAEVALGRAHALLEDAIESIPADFRLFDHRDRLVLVNSRATEYYPELADRLSPGTSYDAILRAAAESGTIEDAAADPVDWLERRLSVHRSLPCTYEQQRSDGRWMKVFERLTTDGGTVSVHVDITELKKREAALEDALLRAEAADRARTEFLANMSHELRTPLNAVIGSADLIAMQVKGPVGSPEYLDYVRDIRDAGAQLLQVIGDILEMSNIRAGTLDPADEEIPLGETVTGCIAMIQDRARDAGVAVTADVAPDLPALRADLRLFKQMVLNILSNAVKFSRRGGSVHVEAARDADDRIVVAVADRGIGIPHGAIPAILAPFRQADGSLRRSRGGTGLGLSLTKRMIELHGGSLEIDSEVGVGTEVRLIFPACRTGVAAHDAKSGPPLAITG